jgi:hypothetical protein
VNANVAPRANANVAPRVNVNPNAAVRANVPASVRAKAGANVGANTRTALRPVTPNVGGDIRANVNAATGARVNSPIRSNAKVGANAAVNSNIRANVPGAGANVRTNVPGVGANVRANVPGVNSNIRANVPGTNANIRANVPGTNANIRANVPAVDGRVRIDNQLNLNGRTGANRTGANVGANANARLGLRPSWLNTNTRVGARGGLNTNLNRALVGALGVSGANYLNTNINRNNYWGRYGVGVNNYWNRGGYPYFNNRWWSGRYIYRPYGYFNYWGYRPWGYWWGSPGWVGINRWYGGYGGYGNWNSPYYYDYGNGGNVVYSSGNVLVDGQNVGTAEEYAQSAAALAAIDPNDVPSKATEDWLGLGTFAIVEASDDDRKDDVEPTRFVQLAIDKKGFVSGTLYNKKTDETFGLTGKVDKETQRMAFSVDNDKDIVFETGLYNLTQDQTPVLVHFGPSKSETFVFVRLKQPETDKGTERGSIDQLP